MIISVLLGLAVTWVAYGLWSLAINYWRARKMNIPIVLSPFGQMNVLWMISQPVLLPWLQILPFNLGSFTRYNRRGWGYYDKCKMHLELGDAWVNVTPSDTWLYLSNADVVNEVFTRRKDFIKPVSIYKMLEIFGRNVLTLEGEDWQRHRKITTPPFNERNNHLVWTESLGQAEDMLSWWTQREDKPISSTAKDTKTLSLHVLAAAGLGKRYSFLGATKTSGPTTAMNYRDSLYIILQNAVIVMMFPPRVLLLPFMPKKLIQIGHAIIEFRKYMMKVLNEEKDKISQRKPGTGNLMSSLVRSSEEELQATVSKSSVSDGRGPATSHLGGLSVDEILGNMFIFNSAGHETTASTLAYGILLLAAHPEWQNWVAEELDQVLDQPSSEKWDYERVFPRLKRCLAVMFETLRLYGPVMQVPKYTGGRDQYLEIGGQLHFIPQKTLVLPNSVALHSHPRYWGEDALTWRPSRWIDPPRDPGPGLDPSNWSEQESMHIPARGSFIPWSEGPRVCPGKKFAQVEFVAVISRLLRTHRVEPIALVGEDAESARQRTLEVVNDSHMTFLLQMRNPTRVNLVWVPR